jgi:hypothetical protein
VHILAVLIVTVFASGGPAKDERLPPLVLGNGVITVSRNRTVVASSDTGRLRVHLRAGTYQVSARATRPIVSGTTPAPGSACGVKSVRLKRGRTTRLALFCNAA